MMPTLTLRGLTDPQSLVLDNMKIGHELYYNIISARWHLRTPSGVFIRFVPTKTAQAVIKATGVRRGLSDLNDYRVYTYSTASAAESTGKE